MVGVLDGKTVGKYVSLVGSSGFDPAAWKGMFAKPQPVKKFIEILTGLKSAKVKSNSDMSLVAIDDYGKVEQGLAALKKQIKSAKGDANFQAVLKSFDKLVEKGTKDLEKRKKPLVAKFHETQKTLEDFQKRENRTNYLKNVANFSNACMKHRDNIEVIKSHQLAVTTILSKKVPLPSDKGFAQEGKDDGVISIIADVPRAESQTGQATHERRRGFPKEYGLANQQKGIGGLRAQDVCRRISQYCD